MYGNEGISYYKESHLVVYINSEAKKPVTAFFSFLSKGLVSITCEAFRKNRCLDTNLDFLNLNFRRDLTMCILKLSTGLSMLIICKEPIENCNEHRRQK